MYFAEKIKYNYMKHILISIFILLISLKGFSEDKPELFRGGMFLHAGFISNNNTNTPVKGFTTGIGGKITFRTGKHLRLGTEGYVSNYEYPDSDGFYKIGWGGLLAEYQFLNSNFTPVLGVTIGGGKITDLYPLSGDFKDNIEDSAIYKVYGTMIVAPHISFEYKITHNINAVTKLDYVLYPGIDYPDFVAKGPRLYIGILFCR